MSEMKRIFVGKQLIKPALDILQASGHEVNVWDGKSDPTEEEWIEKAKGMHALYSFGPQKITNKIIEAAGKQLKVVSTMSVGVDSIDTVSLKKHGIKLGHTPGVLTDAVADITVSLVLAVSRKIIQQSNVARNGQWKSWDPFANLGTGLRHSTVGIVGLGRIGSAAAKRLVPFGVSKFIYTSRSEKPEAAKEIDASYELFNKEAFSKMKKNAILVNIGRGGMIDQNALVYALSNNLIKGAGLDVTTPEPLPIDHPLFTLQNCVILPHIGSAEEQTRTDMAVLAANNLVCALRGDKMPAEYPL